MTRKLLIFLITLIAFSSFINASSCGGNCPSGRCNYCPCGFLSKKIDIDKYCRSYPDWDFDCCKCIVELESKGNAHFCNGDPDIFRSNWKTGVLPI